MIDTNSNSNITTKELDAKTTSTAKFQAKKKSHFVKKFLFNGLV